MYDLKGKKVLIIGLARSGIAVAKAALLLGAEICGYDKKAITEIDPEAISVFSSSPCRLLAGGAEPREDERWDLIVMSPGVPSDLPFIANAVSKGAELIAEIELAWRLSRAKYVAITGTNGKTTTTALTGEIFINSGMTAKVAGNIGIPAVSESLDPSMDENAWLIAEVACLQLETTRVFRPVISALLNITPDHLDRFISMENYVAAKSKIIENQGPEDYFVVNMDDSIAWTLTRKCKARIVPFSSKKRLEYGAFIDSGKIVFVDSDKGLTEFCEIDELRISGLHNLENALAAAAIAFIAGIPAEIIGDSLRRFRGVEHRQETVETINGVRFINDSKGTNVDAAIKAIEAIQSDIILIAGGYDKHASYDGFIDAFDGKVKHLLLMGTTALRIRSAALAKGFTRITLCENMKECVNKGFELAADGDTVLLSPACASWDMYSCFEERGEDFRSCVRELE